MDPTQFSAPGAYGQGGGMFGASPQPTPMNGQPGQLPSHHGFDLKHMWPYLALGLLGGHLLGGGTGQVGGLSGLLGSGGM